METKNNHINNLLKQIGYKELNVAYNNDKIIINEDIYNYQDIKDVICTVEYYDSGVYEVGGNYNFLNDEAFSLANKDEMSYLMSILQNNEEIKNKCLKLLYELKREKAAKFKMCYNYKEIKKGDVIRINVGFYHHYAIYLDDDRVVEFGHYINKANEVVDVHITTLTSFAAGQIPEVRILSKRIKTRSIDEITKYINETLGQKNYSLKDNNCLDYVNRVTLKI